MELLLPLQRFWEGARERAGSHRAGHWELPARSFASADPCFSSAGDTQLRPRRLRHHHPLGLCHGSSRACREHPPGAAAGRPATAALVSRRLTRPDPGCSSLEITAGRREHTAIHVGRSTLPPAPALLVASPCQVTATPVAAACQTDELPPPRASRKEVLKTWTNSRRQRALPSRGAVCRGQAGFRWNLGSPAVLLPHGTGSEMGPVPPEVFTGCSDTQRVIRFASSPQEAKAP